MVRLCLAGEGAQGFTHYATLSEIPGAEVVTLCGGVADDTEQFAKERGISHWSLDLAECLQQPGVEACILTTPNAIHAQQAELCIAMGKHVLIEIPMGMSLAESERLASLEATSGGRLVCMVCHSQRYNRANREIKRRLVAGELTLHHIVQQTYFFRRKNENRFGTPRSWTDDLLWHQLCHAIDMCYWLLDDPELQGFGQAGPVHPRLGIPMDITVGLRSPKSGTICSLAASFNNHGPIISDYRFIAEEATITKAEDGRLVDHTGQDVELSEACNDGIASGDDAEFIAAIREERPGLCSVGACLPVMRLIHQVQLSIDEKLPLASRL